MTDEDKPKFLMIGDKFDTDIAFAKNSGIDSLLVLTGVTKKSELESLQQRYPDFEPTYVVDTLLDIFPEEMIKFSKM